MESFRSNRTWIRFYSDFLHNEQFLMKNFIRWIFRCEILFVIRVEESCVTMDISALRLSLAPTTFPFKDLIFYKNKGSQMSLTLTSPDFKNFDVMPSKYTSEGENISPPLIWTDVPAGTKSLVLIVEDPDAPDPKAPKMTWNHWIL
jgi:hypothetical protein